MVFIPGWALSLTTKQQRLITVERLVGCVDAPFDLPQNVLISVCPHIKELCIDSASLGRSQMALSSLMFLGLKDRYLLPKLGNELLVASF